MPSFTMELFRAIELAPDGNIGLDDYPIFDPEYRGPLNAKIVNHYYMREIGHETLKMFTFAMRRRMHEVMPYYNKLYLSERLQFDPLVTVDIRTVTSGSSASESSAESTNSTTTNSKSNSRAVQSNPPQVMLSGNGDYATSGADSTSTSDGGGSSSEASTSGATEASEGESRTVGYQGMPAQLLTDYRASLLNIDLLVIDELSDLFMGVWDSRDNHRPFTFDRLTLG